MSATFGNRRGTEILLHQSFLVAAVIAVLLIGRLTWLGVAAAAEVNGVVTAPVVAAYDVDPTSATFVFQGSINMSPADGWISIDVLKDPKADPHDEQNWRYDAGSAQITGSAPDFTFASPPLQIFQPSRSDPSVRPWVDGGLGRVRVVFVFRNDPSQWVPLPVQDEDGITPQNQQVIVLADVNPDRTNQKPRADLNGVCGFQDLDGLDNDRKNPCTPNYLSANQYVTFFAPGQLDDQRQATMDYYQTIGTAPDGSVFGRSIVASLGTLQKFRERYFAPFQCNSDANEPEAATTYYNKGDLGIGREMHCINNGCSLELACYVRNFGTREGTARFGDKAEAEVAVKNDKPFATVAMVERGRASPPVRVFFVVYDPNGNLQFDAQLDRKGFNTSIPGNCLQCHGINSSYLQQENHAVLRAMFLPFDLDSFEFFSEDPNSALSRVRQESAFRAQNRMVEFNSRLGRLPDAERLIEGWYNGDLFRGTFNGDFVPPGWSASPQQQQLYRNVYARVCRTCHIGYEPVSMDGASAGLAGDRRLGLQFGTYQQFVDPLQAGGYWPLIQLHACGTSINDPKSMPNAEQTLRLFWTTAARAQLFAQVPDASGDCAPPGQP
jgi:hypothetical protein